MSKYLKSPSESISRPLLSVCGADVIGSICTPIQDYVWTGEIYVSVSDKKNKYIIYFAKKNNKMSKWKLMLLVDI